MVSALERALTRSSSKPRNTSPKGERGLWNWTWPNSSIRSTTISECRNWGNPSPCRKPPEGISFRTSVADVGDRARRVVERR